MRLCGIETEYGIYVEGKEAKDLINESMAMVRAYPGPHGKPWDYKGEDPRRDQRGFRAERLTQNAQEALYEKQAPSPPMEEARSDRVLQNGARLYNDHGHPEYSTPECRALIDLVTHDRAGERIVLECARAYEAQTGRAVSIYKNNTDYNGASYGTHENYLVSRDLPWETLAAGIMPFFVTRQIYAGAGKVGVESEKGNAEIAAYQLSQRADFFTEEQSVDTLARRPILNTRDEPHANPAHWRRFHVICGDCNLCETSTALKVGTADLVLSLLEEGWSPGIAVATPVEAIQTVSRDPSLKWIVPLADGRTIPAVDLQRVYLAAARERLAGRDDETDWIINEWEAILDGLESDPRALADRLDWVAKRNLLETYGEAEALTWADPILQSLDLEYHNVDPDAGLYYGLEALGEVRRLTTEDAIEAARTTPPTDTRAALRGFAATRFSEHLFSLRWNRVTFKNGSDTRAVDLNPFAEGDPRPLIAQLDALESPADFVRLLEAGDVTREDSESA
ncbi:MAG: proteasome accessory factor PafA2 family protein [Armatimonadetes bacterium]|nr:proteasome accessory factor PafA2 family protein [Armatimonadota bacterium]